MLRQYSLLLVGILIFSLSYALQRTYAQPDLILNDQEINAVYTATTGFSVIAEGGVEPYTYDVIQPINGIVDNIGGDFQYLSVGGFVGQETFEVTVTDAVGAIDTAIITVTVLSPEFVPDETSEWYYNQPSTIFISSNIGVFPFTSGFTQPANGSVVELDFGNYFYYEYTPNNGFVGTDSFTITLTDNTGISDSGTITINIPNPNFIDSNTFDAFYNYALSFDASTIEIPDNPTFDITQPANGTVTGDLSEFTYTPNDGFVGTDSFTITVTDSYGVSDTANFDVVIKEPIVLSSGTNTELIQAIEQANTDLGRDTIVLPSSTLYNFTEFYELFEEGHLALPEITDSLQIIGNDSTLMRDSNEQFGFFAVLLNRVDFILRDVSIENASADYEGGAIFYDSFSGSLDIQNVNFTDNVAYYGGAIHILNGEARIDNSQFINNRAYLVTISSSYGGAIAIFSNQGSRPSLTVTNSYFDGNTTDGNNTGSRGGAIYAVSTHLVAQNNIFIRNGVLQNGRGGALYLGGSSNYSFQVNNNCILDNDTAQIYTQLSNRTSHIVNLGNNWWGSSRGIMPDYMEGTISSAPALSEAILGCPTAEDFTLDIEPDVVTNITLSADGLSPVAHTLDTLPEFATVSGTPPNISILNDKVYYGADEFSYRVQTADNLTATGYVTLNLLPDLDVPLVANTSSLDSPHQEPLSFILDISGGVYPYTTELISASANGVAFFDTSAYNPTSDAYEVEWLYLPASDFSGTETLTINVNDANDNSTQAIVNITVGQEAPPTIFVDSTAYENPLVNNGNCTVYEALEAARLNAPVDACVAGRSDIVDIIFVPAGVYEGNYGIDTEVIIRGAGKTETIFDANSDGRVFYVTGRNEFAQFEHLMIRNGWADLASRRGGGIYFEDDGILRVFDVLFFKNYADPEAAAIYLNGDGSTSEPTYFESYNSFYIANESISGGHVIEGRNTVGMLFNNGFADNGNIDTYPDSTQVVISGGLSNQEIIRFYHNCFPNYDTDSIAGQTLVLDERYNWYDNSNEPPLAICDELLALRPIVLQDVEPVISLLGENPQEIVVGSAYIELGATATDNVDGDLTANIVIDASGVDTNTVGSYEVDYSVTDSSGNVGTATRTVNVVDNVAPVISLLGDNPQEIVVGSAYVELGATATDNVDGDISANIVIDASGVDNNTVGSYEVDYSVTDSSGNTGMVTRTVNVVDTVAPVISLQGSNPQEIVVGSVYVELGATATDNVDGDISASIVIDASGVDTNTVGSYEVDYSVTDSSGNVDTETRTVNVVDNIAPVTSLQGSNPQEIVVGSAYIELGATATDNVDGDLTASIVIDASGVDTNTVGSYEVDYSVTDSSGNVGTATRTVNVVDTVAPVISLQGSNPQEIVVGSMYVELGATATDNVDGDLTASIVIDASGVDTSTVGSYDVDYSVTDSSGNTGTATRTVNLVDNVAPVISLQGSNPQEIVVGSAFVELGATATDNVDGDLTASIVIDASSVDTSTVGSYDVDYSVMDSSGNVGTAIRTVNVVAAPDVEAPVISLLGDNPQQIVVGTPYNEQGATATDNVDVDLTANIVIDASGVDTNTVGSHEVDYSVTDSSGNVGTATRTVNVVDNVAPVIILQGSNPQEIVVGSAYIELGATATDNVDGDLSASIVIDASAVDTNTVGSYDVDYSVTDSSGNTGTATRTVNMVAASDVEAPVISLQGSNPQEIVVGSAYVELGATAIDNVDVDLTASIVVDASGVDTNTVGSYVVGYSVTDSSGNIGTATRTVNVVAAPDVEAPVITLLGSNPQEIMVGSAYVELGATATDNVDGDLTASIVINASSVDTNIVGSYEVDYSVTDSSGNVGTATRTVNVVDADNENVNAVEACWLENPNGNTSAWQITNPNSVPLVQGTQQKVVYSWQVLDTEGNVLQSAQNWDQTGSTRINTVLAYRLLVTWAIFDNGFSAPIGTVQTFANDSSLCNTAPSVSMSSSYVSGNEGGTLTNTINVSDNEDDAITVISDIGTVIPQIGGSWWWQLDVPDGDIAPTTVTITATDTLGASNNTTFEYEVFNVAPTANFVNIFDEPSFEGESTIFIFTDSDDVSPVDVIAGFDYAVRCDSNEPDTLAGTDTSYTCTYDVAGDYTAIGMIRDKDGGISSYSVTVEVLSTSDATDYIEDIVEDLETNGILNGGNANALIRKLNNIQARLDQGQIQPALNQVNAFINQVNAFINQVNAFTNNGTLSEAEGNNLIALAQRLISSIMSS